MSHDHGRYAGTSPPAVRRAVVGALLPFVVLTLIGLVVLWPTGSKPSSEDLGFPKHLVRGTVETLERRPCAEQLPGGPDPSPGGEETPTAEPTGSPAPDAAAPEAQPTDDAILDELAQEDLEPGDPGDVEVQDCASAVVRLTDGAHAGDEILLDVPVGAGTLDVRRGSRLVLSFSETAPEGLQYQITDVQRSTPLIVLGVLFAVVVIAFGRKRGVAALAGLVVTFLVLARFVLPALLAGKSPVPVALVGASVIMFVALYITHGFTIRTSVAVIGTLTSLLLTGLLAAIFTAWSRFSGLASEEASFLGSTQAQLDLRGLFLAGVVIGALGVLDDVTVTQASAVWELRAANRGYGVAELYRAGVRIGRDHIASTVNTLVLAYAGASLPLLILFTISGRGLADTLTSEVVAQEVVRALVGSIGLVASVPVTTLAAALVAVRDGGEAGRRRPRPRPKPTEPPAPTEKPSRRPPDETEEFVARLRDST